MKRIISVLLCLALLCSALPAASAAESTARSDIPTTVSGTNGVGVLLAKELEEAGEDDTGEYASSLQEVTVADGAATVLFAATEAAELVVAIYEEETERLVTSGMASVHADDTKATVLLNDAAAIPEYFRAEAFLLSSADYTPLCDSLSTPLYTKAFQELLASSAEDFEEDRVLNLDEDPETNFVVYGEDVKRSQSDETSNTIVSADDAALRYVIEHPDSTVTSLLPGDFWSCEAEGEILIVKVSSVTIEGEQAIILGQETSMEEVFDYAKIEGSATAEDAIIDPSQTADGVTYNGITDMSDTPAKRAWSGEDSMKTGWSFSVYKEIKGEQASAKLNLELSLSVTSNLKYYIAKTDSFISFSQEYKMSVKGKLENKLTLCEIPLIVIPIIIPICGIINIEIEPNLVAEVSATVSVEMSLVWSIGMTFKQGEGFTNTSTKPTTDAAFEIEGKLFVGLSVKAKFCIISSYICSVGIGAEAGAEVKAKLTGREREDGLLHECDHCYDGSISIVFRLKASADLFKFLKVETTLAEYKYPLGDFYFSNTFGEYGWGDCPHWIPEGEEPTEATEPTEYPGEYDYSGACGDNLTWYLNTSTGVLTITGTGEMNNGWSSSYSRDVPWYSYRDSITTVSIGSGVTSIGDYAFCGCSGLTSVSIPNSVTSIGNWAFAGCGGLTSVTIPDGVTSIGNSAFHGCTGLTSVTIPDGVTSIGDSAFSGCTGLTSVTIPDGVTSIGKNAFHGCTGLTSVTIPDGVTSIGNSAFSVCTGLTSVTIPDSVTSIGRLAFADCTGLTSVTIPDGVTSIGEMAFYGCTGLISITVDENNSIYDSRGDCNAIIETATNTLISGCMNTTIPDSVTSIGEGAFHGCTGLTGVTIPDSVTSISDYAFVGCSGLTSVTIPDSVTSIGDCAFSDCTGLTSVTIGNGVTSIGYLAFQWCTGLTSVYFCGDAPSIDDYAFYHVTATAYYPEDNSTWTDSVKQNYGGNLTWVSWTPARSGLISEAVHTGAADAAPALRGLHTGTQDGSAVCFDGLSAGARYVLIVAKEQTYDLLAADNLLYIAQAAAGEDGSLQFSIAPRETAANAFIGLYGDDAPCSHAHTSAEQMSATCTASGYDRTVCVDCGLVLSEEVLPTLGHDYKDGVCTRCGEKDPDYKPVDPTEPTTAPTEPTTAPTEPTTAPTEPTTAPTEPTTAPTEPTTPTEPVEPVKFNDVTEKAWYYEAVNYAVSNGLMNGVGNNNFAPDDPMTRSMLVTVLWRYEGSPKEGTNTFTDVPAGQWYTDAVAWAATNGIVGGVGNGKFDPNGNITREQMAAILFRYADKKGFDTTKRGDLSGFPDNAKVSAYATDAIAWAVAEGIIGGSNGKLDPQGNATRAQVATILMRFINGIAR